MEAGTTIRILLAQKHTIPLLPMSVGRNCWCALYVRTGLVYLTWTTLFVSAGILIAERGSTRLTTSSEEDRTEIVALLSGIKQCCYLYLSKRCELPSNRRRVAMSVIRWMTIAVCLEQTSKKLVSCFHLCSKEMVGRGGLEPPTSRLSGVRSNHLSYRPILIGPFAKWWSLGGSNS